MLQPYTTQAENLLTRTDVVGIASETPNFTSTIRVENITLIANFVEEQVGFTFSDPLIDTRDGQSYATVQIFYQLFSSLQTQPQLSSARL